MRIFENLLLKQENLSCPFECALLKNDLILLSEFHCMVGFLQQGQDDGTPLPR